MKPFEPCRASGPNWECGADGWRTYHRIERGEWVKRFGMCECKKAWLQKKMEGKK